MAPSPPRVDELLEEIEKDPDHDQVEQAKRHKPRSCLNMHSRPNRRSQPLCRVLKRYRTRQEITTSTRQTGAPSPSVADVEDTAVRSPARVASGTPRPGSANCPAPWLHGTASTGIATRVGDDLAGTELGSGRHEHHGAPVFERQRGHEVVDLGEQTGPIRRQRRKWRRPRSSSIPPGCGLAASPERRQLVLQPGTRGRSAQPGWPDHPGRAPSRCRCRHPLVWPQVTVVSGRLSARCRRRPNRLADAPHRHDERREQTKPVGIIRAVQQAGCLGYTPGRAAARLVSGSARGGPPDRCDGCRLPRPPARVVPVPVAGAPCCRVAGHLHRRQSGSSARQGFGPARQTPAPATRRPVRCS